MSITLSVHRFAQATPHAVVTRCQDRTRTFSELKDRVARLASGLRGLGIGRGDRVALVGQNSDRYLEALLAVAWLGATFVPLNTRLSVGELADAIDDAGAVAVMLGEAFLPVTERVRATCCSVRHVISMGESDAGEGLMRVESLIGDAAPVEDVFCSGSDPAAFFYTGGTTGRSKGVVLTHRNLLTSALGTLASGPFFTADGATLHVAPLFHLAGVWPWLSQLLVGGRHVVLGAFDPAAVVAAIDEQRITEVLLVPTMIQTLAAHLERTSSRLPSLRHLLYAGSAIPETVMGRIETLLPHVGLVQGYGMTELAPVATLLLPHEHTGSRRRSAGRAAPHSLVKIADAEDRELPRGQVGQILVRGDQIMDGYWRQPDLTASTLACGWMHTGDAGFMDDDGFVHVCDRMKDMIISGGENVYSAEVENILALHPAVLACAVIGAPDPKWGERVHAVLVLKPGATLSLEELRKHVSTRIARYKAPGSMEVVLSLPVSSAGKVLKRELRARLPA